jgi:hypothetical protein
MTEGIKLSQMVTHLVIKNVPHIHRHIAQFICVHCTGANSGTTVFYDQLISILDKYPISSFYEPSFCDQFIDNYKLYYDKVQELSKKYMGTGL